MSSWFWETMVSMLTRWTRRWGKWRSTPRIKRLESSFPINLSKQECQSLKVYSHVQMGSEEVLEWRVWDDEQPKAGASGWVAEQAGQIQVKMGQHRLWHLCHVCHDHAQVDQTFIVLYVVALLQSLGNKVVKGSRLCCGQVDSWVESPLQRKKIQKQSVCHDREVTLVLRRNHSSLEQVLFGKRLESVTCRSQKRDRENQKQTFRISELCRFSQLPKFQNSLIFTKLTQISHKFAKMPKLCIFVDE